MPSANPFADEGAEGRVRNWVLRAGVAIVFLGAGWEKFSTSPYSMWIKIFHDIGWGDWFRYLTGGWEMLGGLLFLVPRLTMVAAFLLCSAMTGAVATHIVVYRSVTNAIIPAGLLAALIVVTLTVHPPSGRSKSP